MSPLVFDLDGTLIDSRADLARAVNATRRDLGLTELPGSDIVAMVGHGARNLVRRALPAAIEGDALEDAFRRFTAHYWQGCLEETRLYPGLAELLPTLAARHPLAVLTNKPEATSRRILAGLGVAELFAAVVGGDTLAARKPDPAGLHHLAAHFALPAADLVLIGDSPIDAATAAAAGSGFIFVAWGFASAAERAELGDVRWAASAAELDRLLGQGLFRRLEGRENG